MPSLKERVRELEDDLKATPMRHYRHQDLPFAAFCYPPSEEWTMRREIDLLKTRIEKDTERTVVYVSLADLLWQAVESSEGINAVADLEHRAGFEKAQSQVYQYLSEPEWSPLPELLLQRLVPLDPDHHLVFIVRTGALAPNIYRVSRLMDEMKGRTRVPCVLFMPATTEGGTSLRFMGISENEGRGSYHTRVYA